MWGTRRARRAAVASRVLRPGLCVQGQPAAGHLAGAHPDTVRHACPGSLPLLEQTGGSFHTTLAVLCACSWTAECLVFLLAGRACACCHQVCCNSMSFYTPTKHGWCSRWPPSQVGVSQARQGPAGGMQARVRLWALQSLAAALSQAHRFKPSCLLFCYAGPGGGRASKAANAGGAVAGRRIQRRSGASAQREEPVRSLLGSVLSVKGWCDHRIQTVKVLLLHCDPTGMQAMTERRNAL